MMRSWFWLMVIPIVLLALAVWQRIAEYGVTPERYFLCLFAIWIAPMIVYFTVARGRIDLRLMPATVAVLLLFSSFGPWSATQVSIRSQLSQLTRRLNERHLLLDGRLKLDPPRIETFAKIVASNDHVSSILRTLENLDALDRIGPIFASLENNPIPRHARGTELLTMLGAYGMESRAEEVARQAAPPSPIEYKNLIALDAPGARYDRLVGPIWLSRQGAMRFGGPDASPSFSVEIEKMTVSYSAPILTVAAGAETLNFNLGAAMGSNVAVANSSQLIPAHEGRDRALLILVPTTSIASEKLDARFEAWILLNTNVQQQ
jgi:hypothetical protein